MTPRQGLEALDRLVREDVTSALAGMVDWPVFSESHEERPPLLEHLLASSADGADEAEASTADLLSELRGPRRRTGSKSWCRSCSGSSKR